MRTTYEEINIYLIKLSLLSNTCFDTTSVTLFCLIDHLSEQLHKFNYPRQGINNVKIIIIKLPSKTKYPPRKFGYSCSTLSTVQLHLGHLLLSFKLSRIHLKLHERKYVKVESQVNSIKCGKTNKQTFSLLGFELNTYQKLWPHFVICASSIISKQIGLKEEGGGGKRQNRVKMDL